MLADIALVLRLYVVERVLQARGREYDDVARLRYGGADRQKPNTRAEACDHAKQPSPPSRNR